MTAIAKSYRNQLLEVRDEYRNAGQPWPASSTEIAQWGFNRGYLHASTGSLIKQYAKEIARALREEYYTDPQGRHVRTMHAAPSSVGSKQKMLWDDIRTTSHEHMEKALKLRRHQIVGDCHQLKKDQDSYNDNNINGGTIQLSFNFQKDVEELETLEDYGAALARSKPR